MPFYEYECSSCKFYVEAMQKLSDPPLRKCPSCGRNTLKKLISAPVFRLKGAGWYETDFKSDQENKRNLAGREEKDEKKPEATVDSKAESKPDKPEAKPAPPARKTRAAKAKPARKPAATRKARRRSR